VGGVYIHQKHASNKQLPRLAGWWGYDKATRFDMKKGFDPIPSAEGWQLSNAPVLSMAAHKAALDIFEEAGMEALVKKGQALSSYLIFVLKDINDKLAGTPIEVITPENEKGCQVSFMVKEKGKELYNHLMENGAAIGWREPSVIRATPVPLYNGFEEIWQFAKMIEGFLTNK
jgi:kynureninase